ncbi:sensor histidine kinase [Tsuneonella sp. HG222]
MNDASSPVPADSGRGADARRSIFTRLVRWAIVITLAGAAALLALTLGESWRATERSLAATVDTDIAGLADIYASGGERELLARLTDRSALVGIEGRPAHYLLARPDGTRVGGNLSRWPGLSARSSEHGFIDLPSGQPVYARATLLAPDLQLLVARDYSRDTALLQRLGLTFAAAALGIALFVWLVGRSAATKLSRRVARINEGFRDFERGAQPAAAAPQPRDEIGELAEHSARSLQRLSSLARTHRHMSDQIAHEIRTPLTHLDARLVATMRDLPEGTDRSPLEAARENVRGIVSMLDSLLDIAASEARVGDPAGLRRFDLSDLAENIGELYAGSAEDAGIALRCAVEPGVAMLGDATQISRLITNLLDNALKYVPAGGRIVLAVGPGPVISVSDDGPGVPEALRPTVFDRFRSGPPVEGKSSHGLGLALAQAIALRHGMAIELVPSAKGAHFVVKPHAGSPGMGAIA